MQAEYYSQWMVYPNLLESLNQLSPGVTEITLNAMTGSNVISSRLCHITHVPKTVNDVEAAIVTCETTLLVARDSLIYQYGYDV